MICMCVSVLRVGRDSIFYSQMTDNNIHKAKSLYSIVPVALSPTHTETSSECRFILGNHNTLSPFKLEITNPVGTQVTAPRLIVCTTALQSLPFWWGSCPHILQQGRQCQLAARKTGMMMSRGGETTSAENWPITIYSSSTHVRILTETWMTAEIRTKGSWRQHAKYWQPWRCVQILFQRQIIEHQRCNTAQNMMLVAKYTVEKCGCADPQASNLYK